MLKPYRYFVELSYNGTAYHGWQVQPNALTVQEILNKAFSSILRADIKLTGAGRTDTGVHASFFVAHLDLDEKIEDCNSLVYKINGFIPQDIAIKRIIRVKNNIHSRFDAVSRTYQYVISTVKNPFKVDFCHLIYNPPDISKMNKAAKYLYLYEDFTCFSKLHTDTRTNKCKITFAEWEKRENELVFSITADRFLRNMVRAIVGTLIDIGFGKTSPEDIKEIIESEDRTKAGFSAPAKGLFLVDIQYPNDITLTDFD